MENWLKRRREAAEVLAADTMVRATVEATLADIAARWVLEAQDGASPGTVAGELEHGADFHPVVHNAAGMVSVQLGISVTDALIRLRAYAFTRDRLLSEVAQDVVDRKLRPE